MLKQPSSLDEHYFVFKEIAKAGKIEWKAKLLCFSKEWTNEMLNVMPKDLCGYMQEYNNIFDSYWRCMPFYDFLLTYIRSKYSKNHINNFIYDVMKQFLQYRLWHYTRIYPRN